MFDSEKVVSIIIPAYNAMPRLSMALDSILSQSYSLECIEVIVVDDCSTDDTLATAERYRSMCPDLFSVIALSEASGSPARPRNIALEHAKGKYVFFLDADDWLGSRAIELMVGHAEDWGSDVLLVRLVGEGGRDVPQSMFFANQPSVDVFDSNVMWTFGPMKLFRRDLLIRNQIRFPDYMPEDILFTLRAYLEAKVISVASDYGYYHYLLYDKGKQCSFSTWDNLESNCRALVDIFKLVSISERRGRSPIVLLRRIFQRDVSNMLLSACEKGDRRMFEKICSLVGPYYSDRVASSMLLPQRLILDCSLNGGFEVASKVVSGGLGCIADRRNLKCVDGALCLCTTIEGFEFSVPVHEMAGFKAYIGSVKPCASCSALLIEGIVAAPSWILHDDCRFSLLVQEARGHPSFELSCRIEGDGDPARKQHDVLFFKWSCSLDVAQLKKASRFVLPLRRRDLLGKKLWRLYILAKEDSRLVKQIRVVTKWDFETSVQQPLSDLISGRRYTVGARQTQYGGFDLLTTKR